MKQIPHRPAAWSCAKCSQFGHLDHPSLGENRGIMRVKNKYRVQCLPLLRDIAFIYLVGIREVSADAVYNTRGRLDVIAFTEVSMFVGRELSVHSIPVSFSDFSILAVLHCVPIDPRQPVHVRDDLRFELGEFARFLSPVLKSNVSLIASKRSFTCSSPSTPSAPVNTMQYFFL